MSTKTVIAALYINSYMPDSFTCLKTKPRAHLEVSLCHKVLRKVLEEGSAHVENKVRETILFGVECVP